VQLFEFCASQKNAPVSRSFLLPFGYGGEPYVGNRKRLGLPFRAGVKLPNRVVARQKSADNANFCALITAGGFLSRS
jgi:hypothetical protein